MRRFLFALTLTSLALSAQGNAHTEKKANTSEPLNVITSGTYPFNHVLHSDRHEPETTLSSLTVPVLKLAQDKHESEISRIDKNLETATRLLRQRREMMSRLQNQKDNLESMRDNLPADIYKQLASENAALTESEKKEIEQLNSIMHQLHEEKNRLQTTANVPPIA